MSKRKKYNLYVVVLAEEKRVLRFSNWEETARAIRDRPVLQHGFYTEDEAKKWLAGLTEKDFARAILYSPPKAKEVGKISRDVEKRA